MKSRCWWRVAGATSVLYSKILSSGRWPYEGPADVRYYNPQPRPGATGKPPAAAAHVPCVPAVTATNGPASSQHATSASTSAAAPAGSLPVLEPRSPTPAVTASIKLSHLPEDASMHETPHNKALPDVSLEEGSGAKKRFVQLFAKRSLVIVAAALVSADGKVLLNQRLTGKFSGCWEFPGGKVELGESVEEGLVRELQEEIGIKVAHDDLQPISFASHQMRNTRNNLLILVWGCTRWKGDPTGVEGQSIVWVDPGELHTYRMPEAAFALQRPIKSWVKWTLRAKGRAASGGTLAASRSAAPRAVPSVAPTAGASGGPAGSGSVGTAADSADGREPRAGAAVAASGCPTTDAASALEPCSLPAPGGLLAPSAGLLAEAAAAGALQAAADASRGEAHVAAPESGSGKIALEYERVWPMKTPPPAGDEPAVAAQTLESAHAATVAAGLSGPVSHAGRQAQEREWNDGAVSTAGVQQTTDVQHRACIETVQTGHAPAAEDERLDLAGP